MVDSLVAVRERREHVIARISEGYAADLFDVDELERRLDLAEAAGTLAELDVLVADLGAGPVATVSTALTVQTTMAIDDPSRPLHKKMRVMLGHVERRGRWTVPRNLKLRVFWGNAELDFRDASLASGTTTLDLGVLMGNIEIIVPPGLAVDCDVSSFMGSVEEGHRMPAAADPMRPKLQITGAVRLGNLEIVTRLPGESGRDAARREKRERKQLRSGENRALPAGDRDRDR